jgi:hypothetical protein
VSALIHAATMVTAGVYLLCRVNPLLHASPAASLTVAIIGGATAFVAATIACAQQDIKKVLAYSTVSQLGYMFLAIGCGAYEAAIFLMVAHAFFKGLLFLGAGSVIHGLHDEQDLKRMGNLRRTCRSPSSPSASAGWHRRRPAAVGLLGQGRRAGQHLGRPPGPVGGGHRHRAADRLLHEPPDRPGLLRQEPLVRRGAGRRGHRHARGPSRRRGHRPAARVAVDHDRPVVDPGRVRRPGRGDWPCPTTTSRCPTGSTRCSAPTCSTPTSAWLRSGRWPSPMR